MKIMQLTIEITLWCARLITQALVSLKLNKLRLLSFSDFSVLTKQDRSLSFFIGENYVSRK